MSGRGVVLMSGGIDSPVAAYRMMRRGLRCFFLHFSGMPLTGPESIYKAYALVRGWTGSRAGRGCSSCRSARLSRRWPPPARTGCRSWRSGG
jgi:adenylyl- and sulfurtransferase ThiI